jgi:hypothetical protein
MRRPTSFSGPDLERSSTVTRGHRAIRAGLRVGAARAYRAGSEAAATGPLEVQ